MKRFLSLLVSVFLSIPLLFSQSSVIIRNSTWQEFEVSVQQYGTHTMQLTEWTQLDNNAKAWEEGDSEVFETNRDAVAVPLNDTVYFDIKLSGDSDTLTVKLRLIGVAGGSTLDYSIAGPGFNEAWQNDGNFHELQTTLAGKNVIIKYKPDNNDNTMSRDVRFAIHDDPVYEVDSVDFQNPNVLNIIAYNIQMLPGGVSGLAQAEDRGDFLPSNYSPWQDVVINAEAFDNIARPENLIPAMEAAGFTYHTTILNDPPGGGIPTNGGVIIFSKWPIEASAETAYSVCGQASLDCASRKGVKYARINKLGKKYHVFGTHMDAGSGADDINARYVQVGEILHFIDSLEIPSTEPVVFGGDFNTSPSQSNTAFVHFVDTMNPVFPYHIGDDDSNFSDTPGRIIDHIWGDSRHLIPLEATNRIFTMRTLEPILWDMSEFSDHRAVLGRFVYPDITGNDGDFVLCPGDSIDMQVSSDPLYPYQWKKDGSDLSGENGPEYSLLDVTEANTANYQCALTYDVTFGDTTHNNIAHFFYPNGAQVYHAIPIFNFDVIVDSVLCQVGINNLEALKVEVYPNPNQGSFIINNVENDKGFFDIYSSTGALVMSSSLAKGVNKVELRQPAGIYFAVIRIGSKMVTEKLVSR